jgi:leucyl-tRNA synthetase
MLDVSFCVLLQSEPKSFARRDRLTDIERSVQAQWEEGHVFELDAPDVASADANQPKFLATFPYPYMNGSSSQISERAALPF